jgi:hypothetical protein
MTFEKKCLIEPGDITAVEIECSKCRYRSIRRIDTWLQESLSCANCGEVWFLQGSGDYANLKIFVGALHAISETVLKAGGHPFTVKFEIKCSDSGEKEKAG